MKPRLDITTRTTAHEVKAAVATCPYCGHDIKEHQRIAYPPAAVGAFATVYRCAGCRRFVGAPIGREG